MTRKSKKVRNRSFSPRRRKNRFAKLEPKGRSDGPSFRCIANAVPEELRLRVFVGKISRFS